MNHPDLVNRTDVLSRTAPPGTQRRLLTGLAALGALLAIAVGVPLLLTRLPVGPTSLPGWRDLATTVTTRDDGHLAAAVLATAAWACWALFTLTVLHELTGSIRHRPAPALPGLRWCQRPAAALVAAIAVGVAAAPLAVGIAGTAHAATTPPPPLPTRATSAPARSPQPGPETATTTDTTATDAATTSPSPEPNTREHRDPQADSRASEPAKTYRVRRRDTLWGIAEDHLADPLRYPEIIRLNPATVGPDGTIRAGAVLAMPADATGLQPTATTMGHPPADGDLERVQVRPGDTLSDLTEQAGGHGTNWPTAWRLNKGRVEPDGQHFTDPDLIRPGWTLDIPTGRGASTHATTTARPAPAPPTDADPRQAAPSPSQTPTTTPTPPAAAPQTNGTAHPAPPAVPHNVPVTPTEQLTPAQPAPDPSLATEPRPDRGADLPMVAFAGGGVLLAGVTLAALRRYRRRQRRWRRPGRAVVRTPPDLRPVERALLAAGAAGTPDVTWLDEALRSLVHTLASDPDGQLPDLVAACLTGDRLELVLAGPHQHPPAPWRQNDTGTRWSVRRGDPLPYDPTSRARYFAPYPCLATVGYTPDGQHWMLDLERVSTLSLAGDPDRCLNLARFLAAELAHNTWSEMLQITTAGFGAELSDINPERLTHTDDPAGASQTLLHHQRGVTAAMRDAQVDVLTGRLRDVAGDAWAPHVLLIAPAPAPGHDHIPPLAAELAATPSRSAAALVVLGDREHIEGTPWRVTVDADGTLHIPDLDLELVAQQIPADEAAQLAQMLSIAASTDDQRAPAARGDQPWDELSDTAGSPTTSADPPDAAASTSVEPATTPTIGAAYTAGGGQSPSGSALPLPARTYLERAATTEHDLDTLAPDVDTETRQLVRDADPSLDTDLADWHDNTCPRPKVTLLGPVTVTAHGSLPERNPRLLWNTEIVAYLATRPRGATSERYGTDLWPDDPDIIGKTKVRQSIKIARSWLGTNPDTGREYLPLAFAAGQVGTYRIEGAIIDAELFRRLRLRGVTRGPDGIADLRAALELVTGVPFDPESRRSDGYSWLSDPPLDYEYQAMIVDVAHLVATHHLAAGEPQLAAAAAQTALRAGSCDDIPLLDLIAACDAQDERAEADTYVKRILHNHDAEVEEDLPPRTADILFRRQRINRAS